MSQYIQGVVDYIPMIQPFQPDFNLFQNVLQTKDAQYKAGYNKLSSLYGTLLNSPMLREENVELRNTFFNNISSEIQKISSLDLSKTQNVEAAYKVFQPLVDNDYIVKDMAYTKQAYNELKRADGFRNCTNEKECGGKYWEGGVRAIQYQMKDFSKSSADESLGFSAPRYTPAVNVAEKAMKFAKDMGFNMQSVTWTPDGRYQVTTKNGTQMIPSLTNAFIATFQNDQGAVDYYNTQAYLSRKDFIASSLDQYGSEEAAENYYLDQMAADLYTSNEDLKKSSEKDIDLAKSNQSVAGQVIKGRGVDPNDPDDQKLAASYNQSLVDEMIAATAADHYQQTADVVNPETIGIVGLDAKRRRIDSAVANSLFQGELMNAAKSYAELTGEQEVKADPFAVAGYEHALALDKMAKQFGYDVALEDRKTANELLKKGFEEGSNPLGMSSNSDANSYETDPTGLGGSALEADLRSTDQAAFNTTSDAMSAELVSYMRESNTKLNQIARAQPGQYYGTVQITQDMINWAKNKQKELFGQTTTTGVDVATNKQEVSWLSKLAEFLPGGMYTAAKNKAIEQIPDKVSVQKNVGGFLDANGNLVDPRESISFSDNKSKNNWFNVSQRLNAFMDNDPTAKTLFGQDPTLVSTRAAASDAQKIYFANLDKMRYNANGAHIALSTNRGEISQEFDNPEYVAQQLDQFVANGAVKSKEQFVKDYVAGAPKKNRAANIATDMLPFGFLFSDDYGTNEAEAEALYDRYSEMYNLTYNQVEDAPGQFTDFKPLTAGYRRNASGAGVEASPITVRGVDSAFRGDLGAKDFTDIYRNMQRALKGNKDVRIYNVDGSAINEEFLDDNDGTQTSEALDLIYSHLQGGKKKTDAKRARFDMTVHPIIGNNANKVGFTIKLDSEFAEENSASGKKEGPTSGADAITIVMDKSDVTADAYQRLNKGSYTTLMEAYGQVNLDQFSKYGGQMNISPNPSGQGYLVNGTMKFYDPESGTFQDMIYSQASSPMASVDEIAQGLAADLQKLYVQNMQVNDLIRQSNPNLIKDPAQLVPQ
jgi:hypothetical protein